MRNVVKTLMVAVVAVACGCIDATTLIKVNKDGSGKVYETVYLSGQMAAMMAMGAAQGGGQAPSLVDEAKLKAAASKFGSGVTYESAKEVSRGGSKGVKAVYAFEDVTKLCIDPAGSMQGMDMGGMSTEPNMVPAEEKEGVTFGFKKGGTPELIVNLPQEKGKGAGKDADEDEAALGDDAPAGMEGMQEGMEAMMKQMFDGMRMRCYVMVDGEIEKSNATYVEANKSTGKKQMVALMDINFGELIKDPEKFKKLQAMGPGGDPEAVKAVLKNMPGVKVETQEKIAISFK